MASSELIETCSICLLDLTDENEAKIDCTEQLLHRYHIDCIEGEIKAVSGPNSHRKLGCPLCRAPFSKIYYNNETIIVEDRIRLYQASAAIEDNDTYSDEEDEEDEEEDNDDRIGNCCVCGEGCYDIRDIHHTRRSGNRNSNSNTENPPILLCKIRYCDSVCHANCIGRDITDRSPWLCALCTRRREMQRQRRINARQQYELATTNQAFTAATAYNPSQIIQKQIEKARDSVNNFNNELVSGGSTRPDSCDASHSSSNNSSTTEARGNKRSFAVSYEQYIQFVNSAFNSSNNSSSGGSSKGEKRFKSSLINDSLNQLNAIKSCKSADTLSTLTSTDSLDCVATTSAPSSTKAATRSAPSSAVKTKGVKEVLFDLLHPSKSEVATSTAVAATTSSAPNRIDKKATATETLAWIKSTATATETTNTIRCLSTNSDVHYVYALLDAGLLDCISSIVDLSNTSFTIQQKEIILRAVHSLPVKSKHLRHSAIMLSLSKICAVRDQQKDDTHSLDVGAFVILCRRISNEFKDILRVAKERLVVSTAKCVGGCPDK